MPAAYVLAPSAAVGGRSKSTTSVSSSTGSWMRMPAPSPLLGSAPAAHAAPAASSASSASGAAPDPARVTGEGGYTLGEARFDRWGRLVSLGSLPALGGEVTLWRAPTENDSLATFGSYELADPAETMGAGVDGPPSADRWREAGLDRLEQRLVDQLTGDVGASVGVVPAEVIASVAASSTLGADQAGALQSLAANGDRVAVLVGRAGPGPRAQPDEPSGGGGGHRRQTCRARSTV